MPSNNDWRLIISCEHAGARVPPKYRSLFRSPQARRALTSHRGWDPGSLSLGRRLSKAFDAPLIVNGVTRLLIEVNRSPGHPSRFSEFSRRLPADERQSLIDAIYDPHRNHVESAIRHVLHQKQVALHIGSHSFVPVLNGDTRNTDVGILYDPRRTVERAFCTRWHAALKAAAPEVRVRRNYPYLGSADGLTTHLRRKLGTSRYLGIELEVNQRYLAPSMRKHWTMLQNAIIQSLEITINNH